MDEDSQRSCTRRRLPGSIMARAPASRLAPRERAPPRAARLELVARGVDDRCRRDNGALARTIPVATTGTVRRRASRDRRPPRRIGATSPHRRSPVPSLPRAPRASPGTPQGPSGAHPRQPACDGPTPRGTRDVVRRSDVDAPTTAWDLVDTAETGVAVAERAALGTTARVAVWPPESTHRWRFQRSITSSRLSIVRPSDSVPTRRFLDSIAPRRHFLVSAGPRRGDRGALWPPLGGPTVWSTRQSVGRSCPWATTATSPRSIPTARPQVLPVPSGPRLVVGAPPRSPRASARGVMLDLGATAKGLGSDRAAARHSALPGAVGGILVSLGGDIAVAGQLPRRMDGRSTWPRTRSHTRVSAPRWCA